VLAGRRAEFKSLSTDHVRGLTLVLLTFNWGLFLHLPKALQSHARTSLCFTFVIFFYLPNGQIVHCMNNIQLFKRTTNPNLIYYTNTSSWSDDVHRIQFVYFKRYKYVDLSSLFFYNSVLFLEKRKIKLRV